VNNLFPTWAGKLQAHYHAGALLRRIQSSALRELFSAVAPITINDLLFIGEESAEVGRPGLAFDLSIKCFSKKHLSGVDRIDERLTPHRLAYAVFCCGEIVHESWVHLDTLTPSQYGFDSRVPVIGGSCTKRMYRGNGIYPYALNYILNDLKNRHISNRAYTLVSATNNASIRGLKKAGFQPLAHLKGARILGFCILNKSIESAPKSVGSLALTIASDDAWRSGRLFRGANTMTKGLSVPVSCCECGRRYCGRSRRKTFWDDVLRLLGWYPWRCGGCGARFYLRRSVDNPYTTIGPLDKWDNARGQGTGPSLEKESA